MNTTWARQISAVSPAALAVLERHDWPGNIRELKNVLAYAYAIGDGPTLQASDLPPELFEQDSAQAAPVWVTNDHDEAPQPAEKRRIQEVLERAGGSRERAAKILGLSRVTLWRRMKQYGIASGDEES
jgi:transcriptional regulator of acetoin/glycerol metabolism